MAVPKKSLAGVNTIDLPSAEISTVPTDPASTGLIAPVTVCNRSRRLRHRDDRRSLPADAGMIVGADIECVGAAVFEDVERVVGRQIAQVDCGDLFISGD